MQSVPRTHRNVPSRTASIFGRHPRRPSQFASLYPAIEVAQKPWHENSWVSWRPLRWTSFTSSVNLLGEATASGGGIQFGDHAGESTKVTARQLCSLIGDVNSRTWLRNM